MLSVTGDSMFCPPWIERKGWFMPDTIAGRVGHPWTLASRKKRGGMGDGGSAEKLGKFFVPRSWFFVEGREPMGGGGVF